MSQCLCYSAFWKCPAESAPYIQQELTLLLASHSVGMHRDAGAVM